MVPSMAIFLANPWAWNAGRFIILADVNINFGNHPTNCSHVRHFNLKPSRFVITEFMENQIKTDSIPVLSIGIPTYSRARLLDVCLASTLPQIEPFAKHVECVVSDNASSDHTARLLTRYRQQFPFLKVSTNSSNLGIIGNITRTACELCSGQYVMILGDDDVMPTGAVKRIMQILMMHQGLDLLSLNVGYLSEDQRPEAAEALKGVHGNCVRLLRSPPYDGLTSIHELFSGPPADFTASYSSILRREHWLSAYPEGTCMEPIFSSVRTTYPSAYAIANLLLDIKCDANRRAKKSAYIIAEPTVLIYEMLGEQFSWSKYRGLATIFYATKLYRMYQRNGIPINKIRGYDLYQLNHRSEELGDLLWNKQSAGGWVEGIGFAWMLKRYPLRLLRMFLLSLLHSQAPPSLAWIPKCLLRIRAAKMR